MVLADYKGLKVEEMSALRKALKEVSCEFRVVKNTLTRIAAKETPVEAIADSFVGPVGVAFSYEDPVVLAKKVLDFEKDYEQFQLKTALVEGRPMDVAQLKEVAKLPPKDVLQAMLAGAIAAPATKMASLLYATLARLGYALQALKSQKEQNQ